VYIAAVGFSIMDFIADLCGYISFKNAVDSTEGIEDYMNVWLSFLIISGLVLLSEIGLPMYSLHKMQLCCCGHYAVNSELEEDAIERYRTQAKYWSRFNSFSVILAEDGVVALARILIAFKSVTAVADLQEMAGVVSAVIAFTVTVFRHILFLLQLIVKMSRNEIIFSRRPWWEKGQCTKASYGLYAFYFGILFISCCALATTGLSLLISTGVFVIHYDDVDDFNLNAVTLAISIPGAYLLSCFIVFLSRW